MYFTTKIGMDVQSVLRWSWIGGLSAVVLALQLVACSDEPKGNLDGSAATEPANKMPGLLAENRLPSCGPNQVETLLDELYYPGPKCEHVSRNIDSERFMQKHIQLCQEVTGMSQPPVSAASVQISDCGPAEGRPGIVYSKLICCDAPAGMVKKAEPSSRMVAYDAVLQCPENKQQALATGLHMPGHNCAQAVAAAEKQPYTSNHYQRACQVAARSLDARHTISHAAVYTCNAEDSGVYLDVAVCCSATLPQGKKMHPLEPPDDIWEVLRTGDLFALQLLLSRQPERVKERGEWSVTPLHRAGRVAIVDTLLAKKADREARDEHGFTPLHSAVQHNLLDVVSRLLERGAKVDAESDSGETPLSFAKSTEVASLLIRKGANPNGVSALTTPLHNAAFYGRTEIVDYLIAQGAEINRTNKHGDTPLHEAAFGYSRTSIDVVRLLIDKGADINALNKLTPVQTPLDKAKDEAIKTLILSRGGERARP